MSGIRVLLADDHGLLREGLRLILDAQPDIVVVAETRTSAETIDACLTSKPDVVLVGMACPAETTALTSALVKECGCQRIVALALDASEAQLADMVMAGARGCGPKGWSSIDLVAAVRAVYRGSVYLEPSVLCGLLGEGMRGDGITEVVRGEAIMVEAVAGTGDCVPAIQAHVRTPERMSDTRADGSRLNDRERDTVALLAEGHSAEETARTLGVRVADVETYKAHAMEKLEARNRAQLVRYALRRGFRFE